MNHAANSSLFRSPLALLKSTFIVKLVGFEHGIDDHEYFPGQGNDSSFGIRTLFQAPIPIRPILVPLSGDYPSHFT